MKLHYVAYAKENVIKAWSEISHKEKSPITLWRYSSTMLYFNANKYFLINYHSDWAKEGQPETTQLSTGKKIIDTKLGTRAAMHAEPFFELGFDEPAKENEGKVMLGTIGWPGNFRFTFEVDNVGALRVIPAINPYASDYKLKAGEVFTTPEFIFAMSDNGMGEASRNLHNWARQYQVNMGMDDRLTLLNNWENTGFDFNQQSLAELMKDAKDLGVDMFLLDDGWFGNKYPRNDANAGLGDWQINAKKLPEGIDYIASHAHRKGLKFGIWIEPEMVNPKSELAEKHPDWIVSRRPRNAPDAQPVAAGPDQPQGAGLRILGIRQHDEALAQHRLHQMGRQPPCGERRIGIPAQRQAVALLDRLCAGILQGHGAHPRQISRRADPSLRFGRRPRGVRRDEVLQRGVDQRQHRSAFARPHPVRHQPVLPGDGHGLARLGHAQPPDQQHHADQIPLRHGLRGRLGMELQPKQMNAEEKAFARKAIESYKGYRDIVMEGDLYRIGTPYDDTGYYGVMYVSKDKKKAVLFTYCTLYQSRTLVPKYRLYGLDAQTATRSGAERR